MNIASGIEAPTRGAAVAALESTAADALEPNLQRWLIEGFGGFLISGRAPGWLGDSSAIVSDAMQRGAEARRGLAGEHLWILGLHEADSMIDAWLDLLFGSPTQRVRTVRATLAVPMGSRDPDAWAFRTWQGLDVFVLRPSIWGRETSEEG